MPDKYMSIDANGADLEIEATATSTGVSEAGDVVALNAAGLIDSSMLDPNLGAETKDIEASEVLLAGDWVNIHDATGQKVRKADASDISTCAMGFVLVGVASAATATVFLEGTNTALSGLTIGARQFLSETAGETTETPVTASGAILQIVGKACSATEISMELTPAKIRA